MKVYKVREVAEKLAVHELTIRNRIKEGKIQIIRLNGHTIRIPQSELDRLLEVK